MGDLLAYYDDVMVFVATHECYTTRARTRIAYTMRRVTNIAFISLDNIPS